MTDPTTDPLIDQLATMRPATYADDGWAHSHAGLDVLAEIRRSVAEPRRRPSRTAKVGVVAAALLVGGGATATGFALATGREPVSRASVLCSQTASLQSNGAGIKTLGTSPRDAIAACSARWTELWPSTPKPANFAVCVYPKTEHGEGGSLLVIPAGAGVSNDAACAAAGADQVAP